MAKEKKELENKEEMKKELENNQENQVENPPAEEQKDEKKGFHPIQAVKQWGSDMAEKHPKVVNGLKTAGKVGAGVVVGAVATVGILASVAANNASEQLGEDSDDEEDEDAIDSEATEVDSEE